MMDTVASLESEYEKALQAASPSGLTWSWEPSPISAGWTDLILHVAGVGDIYAGAYRKHDQVWYGKINFPDHGTSSFPEPTQEAWQAKAVGELAEWISSRASQVEIKRLKKFAADWKRWKKFVEFVKAHEAKLMSLRHPFSWQAAKGLTMLDYVIYLLVAPEPAKWKRGYDEAVVAVSKKA
jgi:hypothetical protein